MDGPEEARVGRNFVLSPGDYRLVAAQCVTEGNEESIDLFFERLTKAPERSAVLLADKALNPEAPLLETAKIAGGNE